MRNKKDAKKKKNLRLKQRLRLLFVARGQCVPNVHREFDWQERPCPTTTFELRPTSAFANPIPCPSRYVSDSPSTFLLCLFVGLSEALLIPIKRMKENTFCQPKEKKRKKEKERFT
jgi:hypothetical protein